MISVLLFAAVATPSFAPKTTALIDSYRNCLLNEGLELEPSGAEFDDVFKASETACISVWADTHQAVWSELEKQPPVSGREPADVAYEFLENMKLSWKNDVRLAVLRQRAGRKAK